MCRRLGQLFYYIYIGLSYLVQTRNDSIDMDSLFSTGVNVSKLNDDRWPERGYRPWSRLYTCELTMLLSYKRSWPVEPDLLSYKERIPFHSTVEVGILGYRWTSHDLTHLLVCLSKIVLKVLHESWLRHVFFRRRHNEWCWKQYFPSKHCTVRRNSCGWVNCHAVSG